MFLFFYPVDNSREFDRHSFDGMKPEEAAACAVHIHGMAGDCVADRYSQHSMTANDIIMEFSDIFSDIEAK